MEFLRHLINKDGIAPLPEKVVAMRSYETPTTAKELRQYLGIINFYRRFVPRSAETLQPLYDLIKELNALPKNTKISWNSEQLQAFNKSKTDLTDTSYLAYPAPKEPLYLAAVASDTAVLYQKSAAIGMRPLGFFSRHLNSSQLKWTIFSRELLTVFLATKHFSYFLEGSHFTIVTDHQALVSAATNAKPRESAREVCHCSTSLLCDTSGSSSQEATTTWPMQYPMLLHPHLCPPRMTAHAYARSMITNPPSTASPACFYTVSTRH